MKTPLWSTLRALGNSSIVRASSIFPFIGYFILFNDDVTKFLQAHGIDQPRLGDTFFDVLWNKKLYFLYFGLMFSGVGSMIYQWRCPPEVKKHGDWKDYITAEGDTFSFEYMEQLADYVHIPYDRHNDPKESTGARVMQSWYEVQDKKLPHIRIFITFIFAFGALLLIVPSALTAAKVFLKMVI